MFDECRLEEEIHRLQNAELRCCVLLVSWGHRNEAAWCDQNWLMHCVVSLARAVSDMGDVFWVENFGSSLIWRNAIFRA